VITDHLVAIDGDARAAAAVGISRRTRVNRPNELNLPRPRKASV